MKLTALTAISSVDGRYRKVASQLAPYVSEYGLFKARLQMQIAYLVALSKEEQVPVRALTKDEAVFLDELLGHFSVEDAEQIKQFEQTTKHDVVACTQWLRNNLKGTSLDDLVEWVHFGLTSEDCNNIAYAIMLREAISQALRPSMYELYEKLETVAQQYAEISMLARTHGQPATPTTLGKEFNVFATRLIKQIDTLDNFKISVKLNGASGNYCAHVAALPEVDWGAFSRNFARLFVVFGGIDFEHNEVTTQIEPHDTYAELFGIFMRFNTILIDFCQDIWRYISDDWLVQKAVEGEVGSSAMPHKVNPINFENAEGNLGVANALMEFFCRKLPISRLQRDLSDSTVERCFGVALAHSLIAYEEVVKGLGKISANEAKITQALRNCPEVVAEAYQTILRAAGYAESYNKLKELTRGKEITYQDLHDFVQRLDVPPELKAKLRKVIPLNYIGLASKLAKT